MTAAPKPPTDSASERDVAGKMMKDAGVRYDADMEQEIIIALRRERAAGYAAGQETMREENARLLNLIRIMFPVNEAAIEHRDKHGSNDCWLCRKVNKYEEAIRALPVEGEVMPNAAVGIDNPSATGLHAVTGAAHPSPREQRMEQALKRGIGAIEACAMQGRGIPVNWDAINATQDEMRAALVTVEGDAK